jgi:hypothetical protein
MRGGAVVTIVASFIIPNDDTVVKIGPRSVVLPYWQGKGDLSILQVASPVGDNTAPSTVLTFFDSACNRGVSHTFQLTRNDVDFISVNSVNPFPGSGLVVIAGIDPIGLPGVPLQNPIHARLHWINVREDFARVVDPITVADENQDHLWNPLQTAATFYAPLLDKDTDATLHLVCPNVAITGDADTPGIIQGAPLPPGATTTSNGVATQVAGMVYDDEELFWTDVLFGTCTCLTSVSLASFSIYSDAANAPNGTYTEVLGGNFVSDAKRFTGYLAIRTSPKGQPLDDFGRLHNGPAESIFALPPEP